MGVYIPGCCGSHGISYDICRYTANKVFIRGYRCHCGDFHSDFTGTFFCPIQKIEKNHLPYFVPTVFDMLDENGFFRKEEDVISAITEKIESLEQAPEFLACQQKFERETALAATCIAEQKEKIQSQKQ